MKKYFAYIRVSTVKQGEYGSSLQEQKSAIEAYARRHDLKIVEWFEEKETAAKQGRPVFTKMFKAVEGGAATGVITHKIDRSARNLKDWAALGELVDRGIELHFAHESIDLTSRGGRLAADIQAVVAADFIRNLRDEVRKGFEGRLKQGLYPLHAPVGYLDRGGGVPKAIDPVRAPLVVSAFSLYATGDWSLETLSADLSARGLRSWRGRPISRGGLSTILNNPFYVGLIRMKKSGELYQGIHTPLIDKALFDRVQHILRGRLTHKAAVHRFRYQRMVQCSSCGRSLIASRVKGWVYYRCQTTTCPTTSLREESLDAALWKATSWFRLSDRQHLMLRSDTEELFDHTKVNMEEERRSIALALDAIDERSARLTDAYVDKLLERDDYLRRKEQLFSEKAKLVSRRAFLESGGATPRQKAENILQLLKALGNIDNLPSDEDLRALLKETTSNLVVCGKNVVVAWVNPFSLIAQCGSVASSGLHRDKPRTKIRKIAQIIADYCLLEDVSSAEDAAVA